MDHIPVCPAPSINIIYKNKTSKTQREGIQRSKAVCLCLVLLHSKNTLLSIFFCMIYCLIRCLGIVCAWTSHIRSLISNYTFCSCVYECVPTEYLICYTHFLRKTIDLFISNHITKTVRQADTVTNGQSFHMNFLKLFSDCSLFIQLGHTVS